MRPPLLQGWQAVAEAATGAGQQRSASSVAAQCMFVMELTRVLPEWNNWLAYDVLYIRWGGERGKGVGDLVGSSFLG